jgi:hypothetical protein
MSRDRKKDRVPTSEELERQGAIPSPANRSAGERRGILRRFYRAGRFRVSEDVAARKHVGTPPRQTPLSESTGIHMAAEAPKQTTSAGQVAQQASPPARRRTIRIDPSVKERRGLDRGPKR